jgi:multicomponent Na+:H+ antiporter subunit A
MLFSVLSGFFAAALILVAGRWLKGGRTIIVSLLTLGLFIYFLNLLPTVAGGEKLVYSYSWVPSMGIRLDFVVDGLSLLFSLLITGIGAIVFMYASPYMKGKVYTDRFFCYLSMFMASMLGLVLSDNMMALFVFWELTSISSYFLIGYENNNAQARKNAMLALIVTGGGGLLLLAGFVLMGSITGDYSISALLSQGNVLRNHDLYGLILLFILAGAFTKSAQVPFHSWLPAAMVAPTPVSTYLHSATMVKAGVYLLARFSPALNNTALWHDALMMVGGITMLYAAFIAITKTDLKGILAYTTVSILGMLVFLLGIGSHKAILAASVLILAHALYKAGLFLVAGVIDHEAHTRNVTKLSGLKNVLMPVALAGLLAAFSSAGVPFTFGFIGKELIYESTMQTESLQWFITAAAVLTNIFLLYAGFVAGIKPFAGKLPEQYKKIHLPSLPMWLLPLLLAVGGILAGIFPQQLDKLLIQPVAAAIQGVPADVSLKIWHGFNDVLLLSLITLAAGTFLYIVMKPDENRFTIPVLLKGNLARAAGKLFQTADKTYHILYRIGHLRTYLLIIILFGIVILGYRLFTGVNIYVDWNKLQDVTPYEATTTVLMLSAILVTVFTASRLIAVAAMGVMGYCICLLFVFYSAPDLAMTQFTIDTLTVVLFVLVLFRLPPFLKLSNLPVKIRDATVSICFGALLSIIALEVLNEPVDQHISAYYAENAYQVAKGKNVVNVILVDFRGMDTLVEIMVITIAAIGVYSILKLKISASEKE